VAFDTELRKAAYHKESGTYDYTAPLSLVAGKFNSDLCVATLENKLVDGAKLSDVNVTDDALTGLAAAGLDMLALGHESILDLGLNGLQKTAAAVKNAGFTSIGIHADSQETQNALIVDLQGVRVAFLHYTEVISSAGKRAVKNDDCAFALPVFNIETVKTDIGADRSQGAQVVIVMMHWGQDGQGKPAKAQETEAQSIADAGADILLGTHSNVVQPIVYLTGTRSDGNKRPTLVCYSLGALLTGSRDSENIAGMILRLKITFDQASGVVAFDQVQYTPTYIWRNQADGHVEYLVVPSDQAPPESMDDSQRKVMSRALDRINKLLADSPAKQRSAQE
jgi:poly-gamma-glutamate synthesis protein (capsule biosynthesis protein)